MALLFVGCVLGALAVVGPVLFLRRVRPGPGEVLLISRANRLPVVRSTSGWLVDPLSLVEALPVGARKLTFVRRGADAPLTRDLEPIEVAATIDLSLDSGSPLLVGVARALGAETFVNDARLVAALAPVVESLLGALVGRRSGRAVRDGLDELSVELAELLGARMHGLEVTGARVVLVRAARVEAPKRGPFR